MPDPVDTPEFPKVAVRVRRGGSGLEAEIREVGDADSAAAALAAGFVVVEMPASPFPPFPKWRYCDDGQRQIVATQDAQDALDATGGAWFDTPISGAEPKEAPAPEEPPPAP